MCFHSRGNRGGDFLSIRSRSDLAGFGVVGKKRRFDEHGGARRAAQHAVAKSFQASIAEAERLHYLPMHVVAEKDVPVVVSVSRIRGCNHALVAFGLRRGALAAGGEDVGFAAGDTGIGEGIEMNADEKIGAVLADECGAVVEVDVSVVLPRIHDTEALGGEQSAEAFGDVERHAFFLQLQAAVLVAGIVPAVSGIDNDRFDRWDGSFGSRVQDWTEKKIGVFFTEEERTGARDDRIAEKQLEAIQREIHAVLGKIDRGPPALQAQRFVRRDPLGGEAVAFAEFASVNVIGSEDSDGVVGAIGGVKLAREKTREGREKAEEDARDGRRHEFAD